MHNGRRRVLLVEDDGDDCLLTRTLLAEAPGPKFDFEWVATGEEGLERIGQGRVDVALVDYHLGAVSGLDLVREARALGHRLPMILLTGQGDRDVDFEAMRAGAADFLVKGQMS